MAAPVPSARSTPGGIKLRDGFRSLITLASFPAIKFWEKQTKPPGLDGGEPIDTTTMHNLRWHTMSPRSLAKSTDGSTTVAYDPKVFDQILQALNDETTLTYSFRDGSTYACYGYLQKFDPSELKEGEMPEASITLVTTNWDPVNNVEADPVMTEVSGT